MWLRTSGHCSRHSNMNIMLYWRRLETRSRGRGHSLISLHTVGLIFWNQWSCNHENNGSELKLNWFCLSISSWQHSSDCDLSLSSLLNVDWINVRLYHSFNLNLIRPSMFINTDDEEELDSPGNLLYWGCRAAPELKPNDDSRNVINNSLVEAVYMITFLNHSFTVHSTTFNQRGWITISAKMHARLSVGWSGTGREDCPHEIDCWWRRCVGLIKKTPVKSAEIGR